ncbi:hypothetical protein H7I42_08215, partial [Mycolicibacterium vanbaalenii PYR-1]|nr:hypothetical protein [Mycolicibacterium vanbaalenii PYR-1]
MTAGAGLGGGVVIGGGGGVVGDGAEVLVLTGSGRGADEENGSIANASAEMTNAVITAAAPTTYRRARVAGRRGAGAGYAADGGSGAASTLVNGRGSAAVDRAVTSPA